ncbi:MAG: peptide-methionine (S)-S-oxide reductase, partial [Candidatus Nanohaloarchaea archaeon]
ETVLVEYDPEEVSYSDLLEMFWENHDYTRERKPQYASKIFYTSGEQRKEAEESLEKHPKAATNIQELEFHEAEDYHQKYRLRHSRLMQELDLDEELPDSTLAAKANAVAAGKLERERLEKYR